MVMTKSVEKIVLRTGFVECRHARVPSVLCLGIPSTV